ncbi:enoyl-CoA hydratase [Powellomyces hirtus]|nr:enoyl-CoA hydratase [Powellomyces hirtus]
MATAFTTLNYSVADGIATITLNRPKSLNAITSAMYAELPVALRMAAEDKTTAITVLTANGRFFSSGADVTERPADLPPPLSDVHGTRAYYRRRWDGTIARASVEIINHPKVLVAALNGPVVGVAAALISHADIIYASESATLHAPFTALAISPEAGSSFSFVQRMGYAKGMEALLFSKKMSPQELLTSGFVNEIFPTDGFHDHVRNHLVGALQAAAPASLRTTKALIHSAFKEQETKAVYDELNQLTERFVSGDPQNVFASLAAKHGAKSKL